MSAPGAGGGDVGDDGVGAHGEPADGFGVDVVGFEQLEDGVAGEAAAFGVERGGAAVDVVVAGEVAAGGELELAEAEAGAGEERARGVAGRGLAEESRGRTSPQKKARWWCRRRTSATRLPGAHHFFDGSVGGPGMSTSSSAASPAQPRAVAASGQNLERNRTAPLQPGEELFMPKVREDTKLSAK
jgi:hypothetical protein